MFRRNRRKLRQSLNPPNDDFMQHWWVKILAANKLCNQGQWVEAAEMFAQIATFATQSNHPNYAGRMYRRACEVWIEAKQPAQALEAARQALALNLAPGGLRVTARRMRMVIDDLRAAGYKAEAEALTQEVNNRLAAQGFSLTSLPIENVSVEPEASPGSRRGRLPPTCPSCGGRVPRSPDADEIECDYCGSVIQAE